MKEENKKSVVVSFKIDDYQMIKEEAQDRGLPVSVYLRMLVLMKVNKLEEM